MGTYFRSSPDGLWIACSSSSVISFFFSSPWGTAVVIAKVMERKSRNMMMSSCPVPN